MMRDLLPPSVVDCESHRNYFIDMIRRNPTAVELIRSDQITDVDVAGETATATLDFGGTSSGAGRMGMGHGAAR